MTYQEAQDKLKGRKSCKAGNNTFLVRTDETTISLVYHATPVLTFHADGRTQYFTGGWYTTTTKKRLSDYGPVPWRVVQFRGAWSLCHPSGRSIPFREGLVIRQD